MLDVTFLGNSAFVVGSESTTLLVDPFIEDNPECPYGLDEALEEFGPIDACCVTHAATDHAADAPALGRDHGVPIIADAATAYALREAGVPRTRARGCVWGQIMTVGDLTVRALEAHHISTTAGGSTFDVDVTGVPLSFLVSDGDTSVYHMGDTSISRDLELFGELYDPDAALIGVGQAKRVPDEFEGVSYNIAELTIDEAVLAAEWVGAGAVVPMHYLPEERDRFAEAMADADPEAAPLDPGESLRV